MEKPEDILPLNVSEYVTGPSYLKGPRATVDGECENPCCTPLKEISADVQQKSIVMQKITGTQINLLFFIKIA